MTEVINAKNNYNIPFIQLDNLDELKIGKYHYNYKTVDFMFNWKKNALKTLVVFHGRVHTYEKWPVFYKYNFEKDNINILSISDKLLKNARELHNTIYTNTQNNNYHEIYYEIISFILKITDTKKNIFYGSCSGAFPAIKYGSLFNGYVFCTNGYVFFEKHTYDFYKNKLLKLSNEELIYDDIYDIVKNSNPKHIYLYYNKNDTTYFELNKNFIVFCKKNIPDKITYIIHDTHEEGKDAHDLHFPVGENFDSIIDKI
jgi:hypothetical protein